MSEGSPNIIFGRRAVAEALRADVPLNVIFIADGAGKDKAVADIRKKAEARNIQVKGSSKRALDDMTAGLAGGAHQGVVAKAEPYRYASIEDVIAAADGGEGGKALVVICDHITDAGNLGAIIRSAESVGAAGVIIPNKRAAQVTPVTYKSSAGAVVHMNIAQVPNLNRAIDKLKDAGFWVVGATEHADDLLWNTDMAGRIALVLGNEHSGIAELTLKACDFRCKLPMEGDVSSLNVAQASTVFMYEWLRQNVG